jgi:hypothetical protein
LGDMLYFDRFLKNRKSMGPNAYHTTCRGSQEADVCS